MLLSGGSCPNELDREFEELGICHTDAGAFLMEHWRLPMILVEVAREHHSLRASSQSQLVALVTRACRLANSLPFAVIAESLEMPDSNGPLVEPIPDRNAYCLRIADGINQMECF
jgi:hypothetical protein